MSAACLQVLPPSLHDHLSLIHSCPYSDMTSVPLSSNSSSGSQSPSSPPPSATTSSNPSPASNSLMLSRFSDADPDPQGSRSARATPARAPVELLRSHSAGSRGGCWTCRLRRKKCDEQRVGESCQTCVRLKIDCLGWGSRRPDWMRDKQAVEAYKAGIKAKLSQAGMIRGVPRPPVGGVPSSSASAIASTSQQYQLPAALGPGPPLLADDTATNDYYGDAPHAYPLHHPLTGNIPGGSGQAHSHAPMAGYTVPTHSSLLSFAPPHTQAAMQNMDDALFSTTPPFAERTSAGGGPHVAPSASSGRRPSQSAGRQSVEQQHVFYYFDSVLPVQYILAGSTLTDVFHEIIVQEPLGALTHASCALASLHNKSFRIARGLEPPDPNMNLASYAFYERAFWQLANSKVMNDQYSEADAIAALHLISYWMFSGGSGDWPVAMDIACEWLAQTGMDRGENPKMNFLKLSPAAKFAAKATMWMDIFSSVTSVQAPRFLALYRRLFRGRGGGFWARGEFDLRMDALMGCPDDVMFALAEISALAAWKAQERRNGSLSVRELIRRGDAIEEQLRRQAHPESRPPAELEQAAADAGRLNVGPAPSPQATSPVATTSSLHTAPSPGPARPSLPVSTSELQHIYRETAVLYLHTVLSEPSPGVPEISSAVSALVHAIHHLPPTIVDRTLVFPMFLTGCMTDQPGQREVMKQRFSAQDESIGNIRNARILMEAVWQRRDTHGGIVHWQDVMRDHGLNLLLV